MESERFDDELLQAYADRFYGYGSYNARYWFIGMEEGGGDSVAEINSKLSTWDGHGRLELDDLRRFCCDAGIKQWFRPQPRIQSTWSKFIRILLSAENEAATAEIVRSYQADLLGRVGGDTCMIELLPLPSPSLGHWHYARRSQLPHLAHRDLYMKYYASKRARHIRERIREHGPAVVVFSSVDARYRGWWEEIAGIPMRPLLLEGRATYVGQDGSILYVSVQHPVARGITNEYFRQVGALIRQKTVPGR